MHETENKQEKQNFCAVHGTCANLNKHEQAVVPCVTGKRNIFVDKSLTNSKFGQ